MHSSYLMMEYFIYKKKRNIKKTLLIDNERSETIANIHEVVDIPPPIQMYINPIYSVSSTASTVDLNRR
jgi:hypothetical protein